MVAPAIQNHPLRRDSINFGRENLPTPQAQRQEVYFQRVGGVEQIGELLARVLARYEASPVSPASCSEK